jgi:hypothetical protein
MTPSYTQFLISVFYFHPKFKPSANCIYITSKIYPNSHLPLNDSTTKTPDLIILISWLDYSLIFLLMFCPHKVCSSHGNVRSCYLSTLNLAVSPSTARINPDFLPWPTKSDVHSTLVKLAFHDHLFWFFVLFCF